MLYYSSSEELNTEVHEGGQIRKRTTTRTVAALSNRKQQDRESIDYGGECYPSITHGFLWVENKSKEHSAPNETTSATLSQRTYCRYGHKPNFAGGVRVYNLPRANRSSAYATDTSSKTPLTRECKVDTAMVHVQVARGAYHEITVQTILDRWCIPRSRYKITTTTRAVLHESSTNNGSAVSEKSSGTPNSLLASFMLWDRQFL